MKRAPSSPPILARHRGGAVVEFALIVGVMITIMAGIVEFGRVFWYYDALSKATRNAARTMAVASKTTINSVARVAAQDMVVDAAQKAGVAGFTSADVTVTCLDAALNTSICVDGTAPTAVKVEVSNYSFEAGSAIPFVIGSVSKYTIRPRPATTMPYMPAS